MQLNYHAVPAIGSLLPEEDDLELNAYAVDFFKHGQIEALAGGNGIKASEAWIYLQVRFSTMF